MHCVLPFRTKAAFHDPQHTAVAAGVGAARASAARESRAGWSGRECGGKSAKARLREREAAAGESRSGANSANANRRLSYPNILHTDRQTDAAV